MAALALGVLLAVALGLRLWTAWSDLEQLLLRVTPDDAYYYLEIARQLAAGRGPSLDGETATNGFHPLWLALVTGAQWLGGDPERGLRLALSLGALLGTGSVALLYASVRRLGGDAIAALLAAAFYALHPTVVVESVNGLDTALAVFTTALSIWIFLGLARPGARPTPLQGLALGAAGGALLLARTDSVFLWACLLGSLAARHLRRGGLGPVWVAAGTSALCVLPWLGWSWLRFGTLVQISGVALPEPLRADFMARHGHSLGAALERSAFLVGQAFGGQLPRLYLAPPALPVAWVALPALALLAAMLGLPLEPERRQARQRLGLLLPAVVGVALALLYHAGVRWWTREWYFAPAGWVGAAVLGVLLAGLLELPGRLPAGRRPAARLALLAVAAALAAAPLAVGTRWREPSPHRVQQLEAARWLASRTGPETRIGAFNAGILSYFSGRTVVNLDGAVNADAYRARRDGSLMDYVLDRRLDYLVDWRGTLPMAGCHQSPSARCERVAVVGERLERFAGSPIWVLRVEPRAPGP